MTQYQQVLEALKKLGGRATSKDICENIDLSKWRSKTPKSSVSMYLSTGDDFVKDGELWVLRQNTDSQETLNQTNEEVTSESEENFERGIYFITLNPEFKINTAGFLFKIGMAENASIRLKQYSASLPFDPIRCISFYHIPKSINYIGNRKSNSWRNFGRRYIRF
jgi:hypothetical protein